MFSGHAFEGVVLADFVAAGEAGHAPVQTVVIDDQNPMFRWLGQGKSAGELSSRAAGSCAAI